MNANKAQGDANRGRREILFLAGSYVVAVALLTVQAWRISGGHFFGWSYYGALLAAIVLGLLAAARRRWARTLLVALAGITAAAVALRALQGFVYSPLGAAALVIVAILVGCIAWRLQTSPHIAALMTSAPAA